MQTEGGKGNFKVTVGIRGSTEGDSQDMSGSPHIALQARRKADVLGAHGQSWQQRQPPLWLQDAAGPDGNPKVVGTPQGVIQAVGYLRK